MVSFRIVSTSLCVLMACGGAAAPAYAGFDFVPPVRSQAPASTISAQPVVPVETIPMGAPSTGASVMPISPVVDVPVTPSVPDPDPANPVIYAPHVVQSSPVAVAPMREAAPGAQPVHQAVPKVAPIKVQPAYPPYDNRAAAPLNGSRRIEGVAVLPRIPSAAGKPQVAVPPAPAPSPRPVTWTENPALAPVAPSPVVQAPVPVTPTEELRVMPSPVVALPPSPIVYAPAVAPAPVAYALPQETTTPPIAVIQGFGNAIPLSLAVEQIVPSDFTVQYLAQPNPDMTVSWSGGRPWDKVLEDMLYAHGYRVQVVGRLVTISSAGAAAPPVATPRPTLEMQAQPPVQAPAPVVAPVAQVPQPAPVPAPILQTPVAQAVSAPTPRAIPGGAYQPNKLDIFSARSGETLHDVLGRWSDQAMVQLYWQANQNYVLPQAIAYNTTYTRAVQKLLAFFEGAPGYPAGDFHPNAPMGPAVLNITTADDTFTVR